MNKVAVYLLNAGEPEQHWVALIIEYDVNVTGTIAIAFPIHYEEYEKNGYIDRAHKRLKDWQSQQSCGCVAEKMCYVHEYIRKKWDEEDADAYDSWLESRDNLEAMCRRVERKIRNEQEKNNNNWR